jgi:dipeptidyl aminopeptidase/acylaminoacyl peptidase
MLRWLVALCCTVLLGSASGSAWANALPGRLLVAGGGSVRLFDPGTGGVRRVARRASEPVFFPSGKRFAYIREGGCYPAGGHSCYTEYSIFEKSFAERDLTARGHQVFGWTRFFVRAVDVASPGRLVFSAEPGPGPDEHRRAMEIYSSALDGSEVRRLTHNHAFDNDPVVSPDGRYVAFSRRVKRRGQIFSMRIDGTHVTRLTHDGRRNRLPFWAPDGHRLAFISQPRGPEGFVHREIYSVAARGGRERRLTHNREVEIRATYSPDGRSIAFLQRGSLWLMGASGAFPRQILASGESPGFEEGLDWGR